MRVPTWVPGILLLIHFLANVPGKVDCHPLRRPAWTFSQLIFNKMCQEHTMERGKKKLFHRWCWQKLDIHIQKNEIISPPFTKCMNQPKMNQKGEDLKSLEENREYPSGHQNRRWCFEWKSKSTDNRSQTGHMAFHQTQKPSSSKGNNQWSESQPGTGSLEVIYLTKD